MSVVRLPTLGNQYEGDKLRETIRQIEFALNQLNRTVSGGITIINPQPGEDTPSSGGTTSNPSNLVLSNNDPRALGLKTSGTSTRVSRDDHVHPMPSAEDVGADEAGAAAQAIADHVAEEDPHPQYSVVAQQIYSRNRIEVGEDIEVPRNTNFIMYDHLDLRGSLDLMGSLCDASP